MNRQEKAAYETLRKKVFDRKGKETGTWER